MSYECFAYQCITKQIILWNGSYENSFFSPYCIWRQSLVIKTSSIIRSDIGKRCVPLLFAMARATRGWRFITEGVAGRRFDESCRTSISTISSEENSSKDCSTTANKSVWIVYACEFWKYKWLFATIQFGSHNWPIRIVIVANQYNKVRSVKQMVFQIQFVRCYGRCPDNFDCLDTR